MKICTTSQRWVFWEAHIILVSERDFQGLRVPGARDELLQPGEVTLLTAVEDMQASLSMNGGRNVSSGSEQGWPHSTIKPKINSQARQLHASTASHHTIGCSERLCIGILTCSGEMLTVFEAALALARGAFFALMAPFAGIAAEG